MIGKKRVCKTFTLFSAIAIFIVQAASAGWIMVDADGTTTYLAKGKVKSLFKNEEVEIWHIMDADKGSISMVDPVSRVYGSGTPDEICSAVKQFSEEMKKQMMTVLPPEQRKMVEEQMKQYVEMMKSGKAPGDSIKLDVSIKKSGRSDIVANHKTDHYTITVNGEKSEEIWITSDISIAEEEKELNLDRVHNMQRQMDSCMKVSDEEMGIRRDPYNDPEYKKLTEKGLVMREIIYNGGFGQGGSEASTDIVKLERKRVPGSEFSIPSGFRQVPIKDLLKLMMGSGEMPGEGDN